MSSMAVLIATAKVRPGSEDAFAAWKGRHDAAAAAFPGFNSSDIIPPDGHNDAWTILLNFDSKEHLTAWQTSSQRAAILGELAPLTIGGSLGEVMQADSADSEQPGTIVTQVIFSRIKPGLEASYREWSARMQHEQAKYPGYRGMYFQPPSAGGNHWVTMLRFDNAEHLNAWLAAPERAAMLKEAKAFVEGEELLRLATSFPGWVPIEPKKGKSPADWMPALLVLLGLYPIVAIEMIYLSPWTKPLPSAIDLFVGNVLSVAATSFITIPLLVRAFSWWLFADREKDKSTFVKGLAILAVLFAIDIGFVAWLIPPKPSEAKPGVTATPGIQKPPAPAK